MRTLKDSEKVDYISRCLELAILFEVSGYPKPGNIHRTADFSETIFEHYLASAVAIEPSFRKAAKQGTKFLEGEIEASELGVGFLIKDAVNRMLYSQKGGNTLLGAIIILTPIAAAAGMINGKISLQTYEAIALVNPGGLNNSKELDVNDLKSKKKILDQGITLFDTFKIAAAYDSIAYEWVNNYSVTFDLGYPYLIKELEKTGNLNTATVHTFLKILSEVPDTFISRKVGQIKAEKISIKAKNVLKHGGLSTATGKQLLLEFDKTLRDPKNSLSPGTTADITEAVLAINNLMGYIP
ncbi:MAG: triphosphoribosyl-dephospho-CoA synthase [Candidatus Bathyarchaeota archaeon]